MTMPVLPRYAVESGMSLAEAGLLTGIFSIVAIFARPVAGILTDRRNHKKLLMLFSTLVSAASFGYGLFRDVPYLYACRILHGACYAISSTVQISITTQLLQKERMGEGMSLMSMSQILAMSIAPNLGLTLSGTIGNQNVFLIAGGLSAASVVCCLFLKNTSASVPDPAAHEAKPFHIQSLFAVDLLLLALISGLFSLMNGVASSYLSMLGDERNIVNIGIFFTISSVAVLLIRPMAGKLFDRRGLTVILVPCLIFGSCAMICTGLAGSIGVIVVAALLKGISQSAGQSSVQAECARRSSEKNRGVAMSTCYLGSDLGNSIGASLGGWLSAAYGYGSMFIIVGGLVASGLGMYAIQLRFDRKKGR